MSDNIQNMDFKKLRKEVQLLRDELALMKRKYEDILYNLDDDNFSSKFLKEKDNMKTQIEITAEGIKTKVSKEDFESSMVQTEYLIKSEVKDLSDADASLSSRISQTSNSISAIINGVYTDDILNNYLTGIEITPNNIKMIATASSYSIFSNNGLQFYDSMNQVEGWAIEPDSLYGGLLKYYKNNGVELIFGTGLSNNSDDDYASSDMVLQAQQNKGGSFVVDVSQSGNAQVKFFVADWSAKEDTPRILANGQLLATQDWVLENGGTAVFG